MLLSSVVFSCTYKCPIKCKYCGAECGPEQTDRLTLEDMIAVIDTVYSYGKLELVVFTGGEPFLLGRDLKAAVEYSAKKGLLTRIVTNAYWAKSHKIAEKVISNYKTAGLTEINLSCDDYHQEFIPLDRIKYANEACIKHEIPCLIGHKIMKDYTLSIEYLENYFGNKFSIFNSQSNDNPSNNVISTGYTVPIQSDDMHLISDEKILYPPNDHHWKSACSTILQRVIITPRKELSICCGMIPRKVQEVMFGTLENSTLEELISRANNDLIVNWLALEGPYGLMRFIQKKNPEIQFRDRYVNTCHLCSEILTRKDCRDTLLQFAHEKLPEIRLERNLYDLLREEDILKENVA